MESSKKCELEITQDELDEIQVTIKDVQEKLRKVQHGLTDAQNQINDIQKKFELVKEDVSSSNEKKYPNLSAEKIYSLFKDRYKKGYQFDFNLGCVVGGYIILSIMLCFYYKFGLYKYNLVSSIPPIIKSIVMYVALILFSGYILLKVNDDFKRTPQESLIVITIWTLVFFMGLADGILTSKLTIVVNYFFLSIYIISITNFIYGNFKDDDKTEANSKIRELFTHYNIVDSSLDILIAQTEKIEDEVVSAIKASMNGKFFLCILSGFGIFFGVFLDKKGYDILMELVIVDRVFLAKNLILILQTINLVLFFAILINILHKVFNWRVNLYKDVLRDRRLTFALESNKKCNNSK
jgi:membrane protein